MHYRHHFHAANFADVFKHVLMTGVLDALSTKDKPWVFFDTHAGAGAYDLVSSAAGIAQEWQQGIALLEAAVAEANPANQPPMVARYMRALRACAFDPAAGQMQYPGSPRVALSLARQAIGDRLLLCEKAEAVAGSLRAAMRKPQVSVQFHVRSGYEAWSLLPPVEKRGLVLVDPPFEQPDEFDAIAEFLRASMTRFGNGVYAIWYPAKDERVCNQFVRRVARDADKPIIDLRIDTGAPSKTVDANGITKRRMTACGMLIINPPYGFDSAARQALPWLASVLAQGSTAGWAIRNG